MCREIDRERISVRVTLIAYIPFVVVIVLGNLAMLKLPCGVRSRATERINCRVSSRPKWLR